MPKYEFDTARWLRNVAEVQSHRAGAGAAMLRENMLKCAEELSALRARVARLEEALRFILDECDWEESMQHACGDNRIGTAARRALEEK